MPKASLRRLTPLAPAGGLAHLRAPVGPRDPMSSSVQVHPQASPGTQLLLDAFGNTADWTLTSGAPTLTTDTTAYAATNPAPLLPFPATQGIKFVTASGTAGVITKTINLSMTGLRAVRLWTYSWNSNSTTTPSINIILANDSALTNQFKAIKNGGNVTGFGNVGGAWNVWEFPVSDFVPAGTATWASPMIRLQVRISPGAANVGTYTLGMLTYETDQPQGAILFVFDDCHRTIYDYAFPHMRSRGLRGSVFHVHTFADVLPYMSTSWLREMDAAGWDIGNHTEDHANWATAALTTTQMLAEVQSCQTWLRAQGLSRASEHVAYPQGEAANNGSGNNAFSAMSTAGMLTGRSVNNLSRQTLPVSAPYWWGNVYSLGNTITLAAAKTQVDTYLGNGGVLAILTHVLIDPPTASGQWAIEDFYKLVDYVYGYGVPCLTVSEMWRLMNNQSVAVPRSPC